MCLILFAHQRHPRLPLVIAANRDEFHQRPSLALLDWPDAPGVLAGRDLKDGGTWLGVHASGRIAAVTNFSEEPPPPSAALRSRGELTSGFLRGASTPADYLAGIAPAARQFRGFNLLVGDMRGGLHFFGNRDGGPRRLQSGVYGMSNDVLDCDWPKVTGGKQRLDEALADLATEGPLTGAEVRALTARLFALLADRRVPPDDELPKRGRDIEMERRIAPSFVHSDTYGTRASTVVIATRDDSSGTTLHVAERRFGPLGVELGRSYRVVATTSVG